MATIAVFEDHQKSYDYVSTLLTLHGHEITGAAAGTREAHFLLRKLALGEVQADFTLVNDNLILGTEEDYPYPPFEIAAHLLDLPVTDSENWHQRIARLVGFPATIVVPHEGDKPGADGRFTLRVKEACNIQTTTINYGNEKANIWDTEGLIDEEMTKIHTAQRLIPIISKCEALKNA